MDHCPLYDHGVRYALNGSTVALVVRDAATLFVYVYPCQSKTTEDTVSSLHMFFGDAVVARFYAEGADE